MVTSISRSTSTSLVDKAAMISYHTYEKFNSLLMASNVNHQVNLHKNLLMAAKTIADGGNPALRPHY
jgi:hypothetical protein